MGKKRLELLNLTVLVPKTSAYTNSATCPNYAALYIIELICPNGIIGVKINLMSEKTIISPCISICRTDPVTGYCYGCARSSAEKILWKDEKTTLEWKKNNLKEIQKRMDGWQLESFMESYNHKVKNGVSLFKKKLNEQK